MSTPSVAPRLSEPSTSVRNVIRAMVLARLVCPGRAGRGFAATVPRQAVVRRASELHHREACWAERDYRCRGPFRARTAIRMSKHFRHIWRRELACAAAFGFGRMVKPRECAVQIASANSVNAATTASGRPVAGRDSHRHSPGGRCDAAACFGGKFEMGHATTLHDYSRRDGRGR